MKHAWLLRLGILAVLITALVFLYKSGFHEKMSCAWLYSHDHEVKLAVEQGYAHWALMYTLSLMGIVALSLPVVIPVVIGGGYLFGIVWGTVYSVISTTLGALVPFLVVRHFGGAYLKQRYSKQFEKFNRQVEKYGTNYVLILHYLAIVPFFIINTFAALTDMTVLTFIRVTIMGTTPVYLIYAFAGRELSEACSGQGLFSWPVIGALLLLLALALIPMLVKRFRGSSVEL